MAKGVTEDGAATGIELLLAHADDTRPVLDGGVSVGSAADLDKPEEKGAPTHLRNDSRDPNDLRHQQWGVIAPEGPAGDRLLGLIAPLIGARREAQDGREVRIYRVPAAMTTAEAIAWKRNVYEDARTPSEDWPRYLLILGDLDEVSLELQQVCVSDIFVGRLAFSEPRGYEAYVEKVLRWERGPAVAPAARTLFYTVPDGTVATAIGHRALMRPSFTACLERMNEGRFPAKEIVEVGGDDGDAMDLLLEQASRRDPAVLFSMSHGIGAPRRGWRSADEQRALQGAMSFGAGLRLAAEDLVDKPFLPGGVWFYLACFGAGTPKTSAYYPWLKKLREAGGFSGRLDAVLANLPSERPFIAALPKTLLANPEGPLAIVGHADLAWTYSFQDLGKTTRDRPVRFQGLFRSLAERSRVGVAHHELLRFYTEARAEQGMSLDEDASAAASGETRPEDAAREVRRASLSMLVHDLAGYILLGDPAAYLPIAPPAERASGRTSRPAEVPPGAAQASARRAAAQASVLGFAPIASRGSATRDPAQMEGAVLLAIGEKKTEGEICADLGISRGDLRGWVDAYKAAGRAALAKMRRP